MRDKLREIDIRLTELSEYLHVSRPTLYKFIDSYEKKKFNQIHAPVLEFFEYVEKTPNIGKKNVMNYIINNTAFLSTSEQHDENDSMKIISKYMVDPLRSEEKIAFIKNLILNDALDNIIPYLNICTELLKIKRYKDEEIVQVSKFILFREEVTTNKTASAKEIGRVKKILKGDEE